MGDIYTLGIDVGSTASKCIIMKNGEERSEEHTSELQSHA